MYRKAARFLSRYGVNGSEPKKIRFISVPSISNKKSETVMYLAIKKAIEKRINTL